MTDRRVVVTGRGVVSPLGIGVEPHRQGLFSNRPAIRRSERLAAMEYPAAFAGEVAAEALTSSMNLIPAKQRKLMNRAGIFAAIASAIAAREAGLEKGGESASRVGVCLATWFTSYDLPSYLRYLAGTESKRNRGVMDAAKANAWWLERMNPVDYSLKVLPNLSAGHLAIFHQAEGGTRVIADGWRGGLLAVAEAARAIQEGEVDVVITGGCESPLEEGIFTDLCLLPVLAPDQDGAGHPCRPFDATRCGLVLGEGAGIVVLEERDHALNRGAVIFGEILASANSAPAAADGRGLALRLALENALREADLSPDDVDLIHANGDSTVENDRAEWTAIEAVFGPRVAAVPVTATKSLHGHLLSASGAVELVSVLLMLEHGLIPSVQGCESPDPDCGLNLVHEAQLVNPQIRLAVLNAVGLYGEAASLIVAR